MEDNKKKSSGSKVFLALIIAILLIVGIAIGVAYVGRDAREAEAARTTTTKDTRNSINIGDTRAYDEENTDGALTSVEIAQKCKPSVIAVVVYDQRGDKYGEGSGVVMSVDEKSGYSYVVTCAHIVDTTNTTLKIQLEDGTQYNATLVGYDNRTDIGVIQIKTTKLEAAEFGDSTVLKVGEPVYAIGNPGGTAFYGSVTSGIISAIDRPTSSNESGYTMECIQHDAAINPGNSGGALVNADGKVIGINSAKIAVSNVEGIGFAIPINSVKPIIKELAEKGKVAHPYVGASLIDKTIADHYGFDADLKGGLLIMKLTQNGPLALAGARTGDIILAFDGRKMSSVADLRDEINKHKAGDNVAVTILRNEQEITLSVTLQEYPG